MAKQGAIRIEDLDESENPEAKPAVKEVERPKVPEQAVTPAPEVKPAAEEKPFIEELEEGVHVINNADGSATPVDPSTGMPLDATIDPVTNEVVVDVPEIKTEETTPVKKPVKKGAKDAV